MTSKQTLVLGASPNPLRFSHKAVKSLQRHGFPVVPVGIRTGKIGDIEIIKGMPLQNDIHTITMYVGPARQKEYYSWLLSLKPKGSFSIPEPRMRNLWRWPQKRGLMWLRIAP